MQQLRFWGVAAGVMAGLMAAHAYPSLTGPTGLAALPSAGIAAPGQVDMAVSAMNTDDGSGVKRSFPSCVVMNTAPRAEMGFTYNFYQGSPVDTNSWTLNAKYALAQPNPRLTVSAGGQFAHVDQVAIPGASANVQGYQVYAVANRVLSEGDDVTPPAFLTFGLSYTKLDMGTGATEDGLRPFGGLRLKLSDRTTAGVEVQAAAPRLGDVKPLSSLYIRQAIKRNAIAQIGVTNATTAFRSSGNHRLFLGMSYTFGMPRPTMTTTADGARLPLIPGEGTRPATIFLDGENTLVSPK